MKASVEILIPSFNRADFLCEAVRSALAQDYSRLSVIVSDNASDFNVYETLKEFSHELRLKIFRNQSNLGMRSNWHLLLNGLATADWVMILSDDDVLLDTSYITKVMSLVEKCASIALVWSNYSVYYEEKKKVKNTCFNIPPIISGRDYFFGYQDKYPHIHSTMSVVFRRHLAIKVGAFQRDILGLDTELWLKLMKEGDVGFISDTSSMYRFHSINQQTVIVDEQKDLENARCLKEIVTSYEGEFSFRELLEVEKRIIGRFFWWRLTQLSKTREGSKISSYIDSFVEHFPYLRSSFISKRGMYFVARRLLSFFRR